mgnify:CR=1 FL=1|jgi:hypothetical protein
MNTHNPDFVTVDMRGLKAALVARATAQRVSVSVLVRRAVARDLGLDELSPPQVSASGKGSTPGGSVVKLSIRLTTTEAEQLAAGARSSGLSRGAYLAGLVAGIPALTSGTCRNDQLAALTASNAQLSGLSRNIHALTRFLTLGNVPQAMVYRDTLDRLDGDVRRHLAQAAGLLADLRPRRHTAETQHRSTR